MRWIERKPNWLGNQKSERKKVTSDEYGVIYIPLKCPKCGSKKIKCYGTHAPIRYHYCKACGHNFKSIEENYAK